MGRIGLAISPVEARHRLRHRRGGRTRRAASSARPTAARPGRSAATTSRRSPQYYHELVVDPKNADRVYSMDTCMQVSDDGGKTFRNARREAQARRQPRDLDRPRRHRPPTRRLRRRPLRELRPRRDLALHREPAGHAVLPASTSTTRRPFYNVYGGTQDNNTLGGPSRTLHRARHPSTTTGSSPSGGDGFQPRVDPEDPNIVYAESQYGGLVRFDRKTRRARRHPAAGRRRASRRCAGTGTRRCIISPHSHTRLYFAAQRVFRSDDRGDTLEGRSAPTSRARSTATSCQVMGKVWSAGRGGQERLDRRSTATSSSLAESPLAGRPALRRHRRRPDPGDRGRRRDLAQDRDASPACPTTTYVARPLRLAARRRTSSTPRSTTTRTATSSRTCCKSADRGRTWTSIAGDLPARGTVYADRRGSRRAATCSSPAPSSASSSRRDGGKKWIAAQGRPADDRRARPRDPEARERPRASPPSAAASTSSTTTRRCASRRRRRSSSEAALFPVQDALLPTSRRRRSASREQGVPGRDVLHRAQPAVRRRLHLLPEGRDEDAAGRRARRPRRRRRRRAADDRLPDARTTLRAEAREEEPAVVLTVQRRRRQRRAPPHRPRRRPASTASPGTCASRPRTRRAEARPDRDREPVLRAARRARSSCPAPTRVSLEKRVDGALTPFGEPQTFEVESLGLQTLKAQDARGAPRLPEEDGAAAARRARRGRGGRGGAGRASRSRRRRSTTRRPPTRRSAPRPAASSARSTTCSSACAATASWPARNEPTPMSTADRVERDRRRPSGRPPSRPPAPAARPTPTAADAFEKQLATLRTLVDTDLAGARGARWRRRARPGPRAACRPGSRSREAAAEPAGRSVTGGSPRCPSRVNSRAAVAPAGSPSRTTFVSFVPLSEDVLQHRRVVAGVHAAHPDVAPVEAQRRVRRHRRQDALVAARRRPRSSRSVSAPPQRHDRLQPRGRVVVRAHRVADVAAVGAPGRQPRHVDDPHVHERGPSPESPPHEPARQRPRERWPTARARVCTRSSVGPPACSPPAVHPRFLVARRDSDPPCPAPTLGSPHRARPVAALPGGREWTHRCPSASRAQAPPTPQPHAAEARAFSSACAWPSAARHYSPRTEKAYLGWIRRFILFHGKRHPGRARRAGGDARYLAHLAIAGHVSASTQNQAFSGAPFLYRDVLGRELAGLEDVAARQAARAACPLVLARERGAGRAAPPARRRRGSCAR